MVEEKIWLLDIDLKLFYGAFLEINSLGLHFENRPSERQS